MQPTTPMGSWTTTELPICSSNGNSPTIWANEPMTIVGRPAWIIIDRLSGMPTSAVTTLAMSPMRALSPSCNRWRYLARSSTGVADHARKAALAAATALSTSAAVPSGTVPMTSSVDAPMTSMAPFPVDGTHDPSMYSRSRFSMNGRLAPGVQRCSVVGRAGARRRMTRLALAFAALAAASSCSSSPRRVVAPATTSTTSSSSTSGSTTTATAGAPTSARAAAATTAAPPTLSSVRVRLTRVAKLDQPLAMAAPAGDSVVYVAGKTGTVVALRGGRVAPVLDLSGQVSGGSEEGLLGVAVSPDRAFLYVDYTDLSANTRIAEYALRDGRADPRTRREVLFVHQPYINHNGGELVFGPDGNLWIGLGDGGSEGDPQGYAQNLGVLLGKILRISPRPSGGRPYGVPSDNPFVGRAGAHPEIWDYGLRNPWRFSFDRTTRDLW